MFCWSSHNQAGRKMGACVNLNVVGGRRRKLGTHGRVNRAYIAALHVASDDVSTAGLLQ